MSTIITNDKITLMLKKIFARALNALTAEKFDCIALLAPNYFFTLSLGTNYFFHFLTLGTELFLTVYFSADRMILLGDKKKLVLCRSDV